MQMQPVTTQPDALGESPFWHPDEQMLYWLDIPGRQIHRMDIKTQVVQSWAMSQEPGCMAPARNAQGVANGLVIALRDGIYHAPQWGGALHCLAPASHDTGSTRFNDGKADPLGRFWAGTIYEPRTAALAELFSLDSRAGGAAGLLRQQGAATVANGLAWSPDASRLYWSDTTSHRIRVWDWDAAGNHMRNESVFAEWPAKPLGWQSGTGHDASYGGRPDGAAVDVEGNYYAAMFEGGRILKLSPAALQLAEITVPARCPTMPCFGGPDLKTLFVTTASHGRLAAELMAWPHSGCVFAMPVDVPGLPVNFAIV